MHGRNATLIRRYFPDYRSPKRAYESVLTELVGPDAVWLDLGCGHSICGDGQLNRELPRRARLVVGCDRDPYLSSHSSIKHLVLCDAVALPFREGVFTLITSSMVVEHLAQPASAFEEVARVIRPGGMFVVLTPNRFNYAMIVASVTPYRFHVFFKKLMYFLSRRQWRDFSADLFPTFYRANSASRLRQLLRNSGFEEKRLEHLSLAHSFGFVRPLYTLSLLFERFITRYRLDALKADLLAVFTRGPWKEPVGAPRADRNVCG
jgi:ubiquinone/menaquinone biosynthesis C-methylase UbiE